MDKSSQEIATVDTKAEYGSKKKLKSTQKITYQATLVALALILKLVGQVFQFGSYKITFVYIPWILAAVIMGPFRAAAVISLTDFIGTFVVQTGGMPLPIILLSNTLFGFIMGWIFKIPKLGARLKLLIGTVIVTFVCTLGISTAALADLYAMPFSVLFVDRLLFQVPVLVLNAVIVAFLFPVVRKLGLM